MAFTVLKDSLPTGVELISDPSVRDISIDLGTIAPTKSVVEKYQVKVTASVDGKLIENKACFTADSLNHDMAQSGCDVADVKLNVPVVVTPPVVTPPVVTPPVVTPVVTPVVKPIAVVKAEQPKVLPNTGVGTTIVVIAGFTTALGYIVNMLRLKHRTNA